MDQAQLLAALNKAFFEEENRIVFWHDPDGDFTNALGDIELDGVTVLNTDPEDGGIASLELKILLEQEDPEGRYLLYSPAEEPEYADDWLLDIRAYSRGFRADRASILLDELGLTRQRLRAHISQRRKFFDSKDRVRRLKQIVSEDDNELDLDLKMIAVVSRSDQPDPMNVLLTLLHAMVPGSARSGGEEADTMVDLNVAPEVWKYVEKYDLNGSFWEVIHSLFGYEEESPTLRNLLIRLMVSDFAHKLNEECPAAWQHLSLNRAGTANAVVCLGQWRDSSSKAGSFNVLSGAVGNLLKIRDELHGVEAESLLEVMTFAAVEKAVVLSLRRRIRSTAETLDAASIRRIVSQRKKSHWVTSLSIPERKRQEREAVYNALALAAELFDLRNHYQAQGGFDYPDAGSMYQAYEKELYRFDQLHRRFCWNADEAALKGQDLLKELRASVESCYRNWFLVQLGLAWDAFLGSGLLETWSLAGVPNQYKFYSWQVKQRLNETDRRKVFVVVSDALRYEVAEEINRRLNGTYRLESDLRSQLGVLPSYTALGMASLLPHETLEYNKKGDVFVDGQRTSSFDQRRAILAKSKPSGLAVKATHLLKLKKEEGRQLIGDHRCVYIYHDEIDARGDKASTEAGTFGAVHDAVDDLVDLVRYIVNNLNGNYVLVTADHGFLFTETPPDATDKSQLTEKPAGTVKAKKRYLLGFDLPENMMAWRGRTKDTAKAAGDMEFWLPKGTNRFHFTGGARFVHGGATLQEIVVPLLTVKHMKNKGSREKTREKTVSVQVLAAKHKITTPQHRFRLIQMESVSERVRPVTLRVGVYDGEEPVTSLETVTFDSTSTNIDERQKWVTVTLKEGSFDKKKTYRLVLRDSETGVEAQAVDVTIDRAISDDFDF